ncbi:ribose ABC transporter periplasmic binding protein [Rhodopirellula maiorica SM1]|uniref:Ribose ABC transporter periplasmic binding protein n=1 Tax=Rhodopirellula maiorica SM1 TaxID=1265738 RepID=M5RCG3_9BACT|nr:sugar ABC transporter substrate-binding protein [Rhodopirellula maiorica]EMI16751.1 ribose ABC transporter periplasmic binding protein [Rhodopirellula maiorica SM1]
MNVRHFILLLSLLTLVGCNSSSSTPEDQQAAGTDNEKPRVALIMKSLANEFFSTMADGATEHQAEHSDDYDLVVNGIKDERDLSRQVSLVEEMVASGVDAIVIAPADSKALVPALRRASQAGVVVINIDNRLDADVLEQEQITIPFVGPDNMAGAKKVGDHLAAKLEKGDKVAILEGIRTSFNAQQRLKGFQAAMQDAGLEIVDSQTAEWEMSKANTIASSMLSEHPEIKAILAANDSMALGAIAAVKSAGRDGEVMIVGFDNITAIQEAIKQGKVLATADQHGDQLAVFGIEAALKQLQEPYSATADVETPVDLVTKESL